MKVFLACTCLKTVKRIWAKLLWSSFWFTNVNTQFFLQKGNVFPNEETSEPFSTVRLYYSKMCMMCLSACTCMHMHLSVCMLECVYLLLFFFARACFTQQNLIPLGRPYSSSQECVLNALFSKTHKNLKIVSFLVFLCFWVAERALWSIF